MIIFTFLFRVIVYAICLYFIHSETGTFTVLFLSMMFIFNEYLGYLLRKINRCTKYIQNNINFLTGVKLSEMESDNEMDEG